MNVSFPSLLFGAAGVVYFLYLSATKGVPAAWNWLKSKAAAGRDFAYLGLRRLQSLRLARYSRSSTCNTRRSFRLDFPNARSSITSIPVLE
jgi:hypothetical protein